MASIALSRWAFISSLVINGLIILIKLAAVVGIIGMFKSKEREEGKSASRRLTSPMVIGGEDRMGAREFKVAAVLGIIGMSSGGSGGEELEDSKHNVSYFTIK